MKSTIHFEAAFFLLLVLGRASFSNHPLDFRNLSLTSALPKEDGSMDWSQDSTVASLSDLYSESG